MINTVDKKKLTKFTFQGNPGRNANSRNFQDCGHPDFVYYEKLVTQDNVEQ